MLHDQTIATLGAIFGPRRQFDWTILGPIICVLFVRDEYIDVLMIISSNLMQDQDLTTT
jgi:hypothetical protein